MQCSLSDDTKHFFFFNQSRARLKPTRDLARAHFPALTAVASLILCVLIGPLRFYRPNCILCYFQAQAEERATMLRAQLEQRKKAILERINKEGKDKLEKV